MQRAALFTNQHTIPFLSFLITLSFLLLTVAPSIHTLDSPEFVIGADTLGIVHAPGYPLYLLIAHLFTYLPVDTVAFGVNLLSVFSLAATTPVLYWTIYTLFRDRWIALASSIMCIASYRIWATGIVAEVYAPQLLTLAIGAWLLATLYRQTRDLEKPPQQWLILLSGAWFGLCVAMAPSSILFAPGMVMAYLLLRVRWKMAILSGILSIVVFLLPLVYFPVRHATNPAFNVAGYYDKQGNFHSTDLQSPAGVWKVIRGEAFEDLFFEDGYLPSAQQLARFGEEFTANFLGIGAVIGLLGIVMLYQEKRGVFWTWLAFFLPYTYFFTNYGAEDVQYMFGPTYLVWTIAFAYGAYWALHEYQWPVKMPITLTLAILLLVVNFPRLDLSDDTGVRDNAAVTLQYLPQDSVVFGKWLDVVPLQYLQIVENKHTDVKVYNLRLFNEIPDIYYFRDQGKQVFLTDEETARQYGNLFGYAVRRHHIPDEDEVHLYELVAANPN